MKLVYLRNGSSYVTMLIRILYSNMRKLSLDIAGTDREDVPNRSGYDLVEEAMVCRYS